MKRKCPLCGSVDVAEYLWGDPAWSEQLEKDIADHRIILGGCCVTGNEPSAHCNACGKDFGKPPYLRKRRGQKADAPRELFPDVVTGIGFSEGGYFGGDDVVEITTDEKGHHSLYKHYPDMSDSETSYTRDLTNTQWKKLLETLFYKLCIHEWKQSYVDRAILDGTQWGLELSMTNGRHYNISGSNAFPALYKDLVRAFRPYMKKAKEG